MITSRYIRKKAASILCGVTLLGGSAGMLMLYGCTADDFDAIKGIQADYDKDTQLVINLAIPQGEELSEMTRAAEVSPAYDNELQVNSLRLLIFPKGGGAAVINRPLLIPEASQFGKITYQVSGLTPDKNYRMYVIANMGDAAAMSSLAENSRTEGKLREILMDYTSQMPQPGNLPMIYEPANDDTYFTAPKIGNTPLQEDIVMTYACVKVKFNLIFDKDGNTTTSTNYEDQGFKPSSVKFSHISTKTPLVINSDTQVQKEKIQGDAEISVPLTGENSVCYFTSWTNNPLHNNTYKEQITDPSGATKTPNFADKWLMQYLVYLPERYDASKQLTMTLEGNLTDKNGTALSTKCNFDPLKIGVDDSGVAETDLKRGCYYEVIANITKKDVDGVPLDATIKKMDWMSVSIPSDFVHTYLTLSKDHDLMVKSLTKANLYYETDGTGGVSFVCESKVQDKPVLNSVEKTDETGRKYLELSINPNINIAALDETIAGRATAWVSAGNIKKAVYVNYEITPFFEITPIDGTISYVVGGDNDMSFSYRTNLGGFRLYKADGTTLLFGNGDHDADILVTEEGSELRISLPSGKASTASSGDIFMTATKDPGTTTTHYFVIKPIRTDADKYTYNLSVTVQPESQDYRIYFRAINDYSKNNSGIDSYRSEEFLKEFGYILPTESKDNNWRDGWNNASTASGANNHCIYIYNQIGNNSSFGANDQPVAYFGKKYDEYQNMTKDSNNPGWWYMNLEKNSQATLDENSVPSGFVFPDYYKIPRPGETLLIFNNHDSNTIHRLAHANEPGVPLFSCADGESWTLYDPTRVPRYNQYDNKPSIVDVDYEIYSDKPLRAWYIRYGSWQIDKNNYDKLGLWSTHWWENSSENNRTVTESGKTYYKNVIHLKSVRDEYDKAIQLIFSNDALQTKTYIWYINNDGDYDANKWKMSDPYVYFNGGADWPGYKMTYYGEENNNGSKRWIHYLEVEDRFLNSGFILNGNGVQYPGDGKGWLYLLTSSGKRISSEFYSDYMTAQSAHWTIENTPKVNPADPQLNDGESYPATRSGNKYVVKSYYNTTTKKWSKNPN